MNYLKLIFKLHHKSKAHKMFCFWFRDFKMPEWGWTERKVVYVQSHYLPALQSEKTKPKQINKELILCVLHLSVSQNFRTSLLDGIITRKRLRFKQDFNSPRRV